MGYTDSFTPPPGTLLQDDAGIPLRHLARPGSKSSRRLPSTAHFPATLNCYVRTPLIGQIVVLRNVEGFYAAVQVLEIKDDTRGDDSDELRFRYAIQPDGYDHFAMLRTV